MKENTVNNHQYLNITPSTKVFLVQCLHEQKTPRTKVSMTNFSSKIVCGSNKDFGFKIVFGSNVNFLGGENCDVLENYLVKNDLGLGNLKGLN